MPAKPKKNGRQNYNWNLIMNDYITDPGSSLRKMSEKYGIRLTTIAEKSKADNWFATKQEYQEKIRTKAASKAVTKKANALAKELESVDKASDVIVKMFADADQFNRHLAVNIVTGETVEKKFDKYDTKALKDALSCLKMIEDMKRSMLEEQKVNERQKYEIESARLELEKERLALERERNALRNQNTDKDENSYGVVLIPEVIAYEE